MRELTAHNAPPGSTGRPRIHWSQPAAYRLVGSSAPLLCAVIGLAAFLRLWNLGGVGFRGDEAVYAGQSAVLAGAEAMRRHFILVSRGNSNFLLYQQMVALVYRAVGISDVAARVVAALCSTLTVPVTFAIAKLLYGRRVALYAALLLALSSYAVALGRLALLDSMLTLLFSLGILFLVKWEQTSSRLYLCAFAAAAAFTIQAKLIGSLLVVVFGLYLLLGRRWRALTLRDALLAAGVFTACLTPVILQLAASSREFAEFLSTSSHRVSKVPWYYYVRTLVRYEGAVVVALWAVGIVAAVVRRSRADLLPLLWIAVIGGFYQLYPLKAFNYLLPIVPALSLLAGRLLGSLSLRLLPRTALAAALAVGLIACAAPQQRRVLDDDSYGGLREAGRWLATHAPRRAGVMTLSHGSAQYVFSFYERQDAYPFGRFRLATVLPGGQIVNASATRDGSTPRDWVAFWPPRLIASGKVTYLVYYTGPLDDPPEDSQVVRTSTQRMFRSLIQRYDGRLVHTVYLRHEPRVWIYQISRSLANPVLHTAPQGRLVKLTGKGFAANAAITFVYHNQLVARGRAAADGSLSANLQRPRLITPAWLLTATDEAGNHASVRLPVPIVKYAAQGTTLKLTGTGFAKRSPVVVSYHGHPVARGRTRVDGSLSVTFPRPARTAPSWRLVVSDDVGNYAWLQLLKPTVQQSVGGGVVRLHATGFTGNSLVTASYHGKPLAQDRADAAGAALLTFRLSTLQPDRHLIVIRDQAGNATTVAAHRLLQQPQGSAIPHG
jgi:Dolichyl-phosphate-mannose-protein mannosyltransferase